MLMGAGQPRAAANRRIDCRITANGCRGFNPAIEPRIDNRAANVLVADIYLALRMQYGEPRGTTRTAR